MWTVVGGQDRRAIGRLCQTSTEAERWAKELIRAGIVPVRINGAPFEPEGSNEDTTRPGVDASIPGRRS